MLIEAKLKENAKFYALISSLVLILIVLSLQVISHEEAKETIKEEDHLINNIKTNPIDYIIVTSLIIGFFMLVALSIKNKNEAMNWILFLGIAIPTLVATIFLAVSTINLNLTSATKGPVHWHADFEIWKCGNKIDLINPKGISNRIGTPVFHEHGDDRIHVEGVVVNQKDVDLHNFFQFVGGMLTEDSLSVPTEYGFEEIKNGDFCNGNQGILQVFLYKIKNPESAKNWIFEQVKLEDFEDYILSPYPQVPPGDCIIIEFNENKERTDRICETYNVAIQRGELSEII